MSNVRDYALCSRLFSLTFYVVLQLNQFYLEPEGDSSDDVALSPMDIEEVIDKISVWNETKQQWLQQDLNDNRYIVLCRLEQLHTKKIVCKSIEYAMNMIIHVEHYVEIFDMGPFESPQLQTLEPFPSSMLEQASPKQPKKNYLCSNSSSSGSVCVCLVLVRIS